jgi:hypothetical protein
MGIRNRILVFLIGYFVFTNLVLANTSPVAADTFLQSNVTTNNNGKVTLVYADFYATPLLKFSLTGLPQNLIADDIAKATLFIYIVSVPTAGRFQLSQVAGTWNEYAVTYSSRPLFQLPSLTTNAISSTNIGNYFAIDITEMVKSWVTDPANNFGLTMKPDPATPTAAITFDSKEQTTTSHPAFIDVVLSGQPNIGIKGDKGDIGLTGLTGATGPIGPTGPAGPVVHSSAVCVNGSINSAGGMINAVCTCSNITITRVTGSSGCSATSDTGQCSATGHVYTAYKASNGYLYNGFTGSANCCVCGP